jgi:hypothetical protein
MHHGNVKTYRLTARRRKIALAMAAALVLAVPIQATTAGAIVSDDLTLEVNVTSDEEDPFDDGCTVDQMDPDYATATWNPVWVAGLTSMISEDIVLDGITTYTMLQSVSFEWADGTDNCGGIVDASGYVAHNISFGDPDANVWDTRFLCPGDCFVDKVAEVYSPGTADVEIDIPGDAAARTYTATVTLTWTP